MRTVALSFLLPFQIASAQESPIARISVSPTPLRVSAGDSLRIRAQALDASGKVVPGVTVRFSGVGVAGTALGGTFEAKVDSTGLVIGGAVGILPVSIIALTPGAKPFIHRVEVQVVPGPAARIELDGGAGRLVAGQQIRMSGRAFSALGDRTDDRLTWTSSSPATVQVQDGVVDAVAAGRATITVRAGNATATHAVAVIPNTIARVEVTPAVARVRQGDVVRFTAIPKDRAGNVIQGLTPTWHAGSSPGVIDQSGAFVAYSPGAHRVTADFGVRSGSATVEAKFRDARRPVTVVSRMPAKKYMYEIWLHPNGKYLYVSGGLGDARYYVVDVSNPANPVVVDSLLEDGRSSGGTNDVMSTPDGKYLVHTTGGSSNRKDGLKIVSIEDPARPKEIAGFSEGMTGGTHSAFVYRQEKFGTHVYATNNGTGSLDIVDITDPYRPKKASSWRTPRPAAGRMLHDVDVQDGLAYLSYWNDGLVILDVGNGIKGGSPTNPQLVSQLTYDLNAVYRDVEAIGGPGFIRGTHTAWRHGKYVFVGDEVAPAERPTGTGNHDLARGAWFGRLHVVDVSDLTRPKIVAWYEPEFGGVHNIWVAGDTLYLAAYQGGFHAFDVSGELLGDLRAQGREIASMMTGDPKGWVPNFPEAWSAIYRDGFVYVPDMYSGLWILRIEPKSKVQSGQGPPIP